MFLKTNKTITNLLIIYFFSWQRISFEKNAEQFILRFSPFIVMFAPFFNIPLWGYKLSLTKNDKCNKPHLLFKLF